MKVPKIHPAIKEHLHKHGVLYIVLGLCVAVVVIAVVFGISKSHLKENDNKSMSKELDTIPNKVSSFNALDGNYHHNVRDYYIMSSYNSCCGGDFSNSYVDYEPLKMVIRPGS